MPWCVRCRNSFCAIRRLPEEALIVFRIGKAQRVTVASRVSSRGSKATQPWAPWWWTYGMGGSTRCTFSSGNAHVLTYGKLRLARPCRGRSSWKRSMLLMRSPGIVVQTPCMNLPHPRNFMPGFLFWCRNSIVLPPCKMRSSHSRRKIMMLSPLPGLGNDISLSSEPRRHLAFAITGPDEQHADVAAAALFLAVPVEAAAAEQPGSPSAVSATDRLLAMARKRTGNKAPSAMVRCTRWTEQAELLRWISRCHRM